jgi:hypothetical protein
MPKVRKRPSLSSLSRNDLNIPSERWSHHTTGTRDLVIHLLGHYGPPFSGCGRLFGGWERLDDSPSHLQHYINRRVGVKLPQHLLPLFCCAAKKFDHNQSSFTILSIKASFCFNFVTRERASEKTKKHPTLPKRKKFSIKWPGCARQLG